MKKKKKKNGRITLQKIEQRLVADPTADHGKYEKVINSTSVIIYENNIAQSAYILCSPS